MAQGQWSHHALRSRGAGRTAWREQARWACRSGIQLARSASHSEKHARTWPDQLAPRYASVIVFDSVHRLKSNAGLQQQMKRLVLRQRQDSGNLSSYEEIWSAQLVVGAYVCASRLDRGHQHRQEKLAAPWSGSAGCVLSGTRRRRIGRPDGCSTAPHLDGNRRYGWSFRGNESRDSAEPARSSENQEPRGSAGGGAQQDRC